MKTKEEQIEDLKATAVKLQQQIKALEKPKQWEPRGGDYWVCAWGDVFDGDPIARTSKFGAERQTAEAAEKASAAMRTHNRLLAYVDEFGGDWGADWGDADQAKYCLFYDYSMREWDIETTYEYCVSGTVYMSPNCALELADKLKTGEVVL